MNKNLLKTLIIIGLTFTTITALQAKVAVIGAGLAGLTAAYNLDNKGFDVELYEARERPGGRVHSAILEHADGTTTIAELGAQNIGDGGDAEYLLALAAMLGLEIETQYISSGIEFHNEAEHSDLYDSVRAEPLNTESLHQQIQALRTNSELNSLQDAIDIIFPEDTPFKQMVELRLRCDIGSDLSDLDPYYNLNALHYMAWQLMHMAEQETGPILIENTSIKGGNAMLPLTLAEHLREKIYYGKVLKSVHESGDQIKLTFTDGSTVECEELILAIPASVYKNIEFDNTIIPAERLQKINAISYGTLSKILVPIEETDALKHNDASRQSIAFTTSNTRVLNLFFGGETGANVAKNKDDLFRNSMGMVKSSHGPVFGETSPIIADDKAFTHYKGSITKSWKDDSFTQGSYSTYGKNNPAEFATTSEYEGVEIKTLFLPIDNRVFFAGEHLSIENNGSMEGAVESGYQVSELF